MSNENSKLKIVKMSDVELQEINWLWYPYIPFGKISIIQGDPGEGKTTLALRLAAACSTGQPFPGMETTEPFNVIYQTAEDGLGDTIKPRLMEAGADRQGPEHRGRFSFADSAGRTDRSCHCADRRTAFDSGSYSGLPGR